MTRFAVKYQMRGTDSKWETHKEEVLISLSENVKAEIKNWNDTKQRQALKAAAIECVRQKVKSIIGYSVDGFDWLLMRVIELEEPMLLIQGSDNMPQIFGQVYELLFEGRNNAHLMPFDLATLAAGPGGSMYYDCWQNVLEHFRVWDATGQEYALQEGIDLFLYPVIN